VVATTLEDIARQVTACRNCDLCRTRHKAVPGEGPATAKIVFIGEAPGWNENQQGRPFVGAAGQFLTELLASIGLKRQDVYITNVVKCQPPGNRDPLPDEIAACGQYLDAQLALLKPKMVVTLGRYSMARWFPNARISQIHGQPRKLDGVVYFPMYHPAAALHQPSLRAIVEADMLKIPRLLAELEQVEEAEQAPPPPQQLSLF
jgi:uracil-DNA glycosylase family 4